MTMTLGDFLSVVGSLLAAYAFIYVGTAFLAPRFFLDTISVNDVRFKKRELSFGDESYKWTHKVAVAAVGVGLLILFYHAAGALTAWMPSDWDQVDADSEDLPIRYTIQAMLALVSTAVVVVAVIDRDANAHQLVPPKGLEISAWARRGYNLGTEHIAAGLVAGLPELKPSHWAAEFSSGYALRFSEQGAADAQAGVYRAAAFGDQAPYIQGWRRAALKLRQSGWSHPTVDAELFEFDELERAARLKEKKAREAAEKASWTARLGFDPEQILRDTE